MRALPPDTFDGNRFHGGIHTCMYARPLARAGVGIPDDAAVLVPHQRIPSKESKSIEAHIQDVQP